MICIQEPNWTTTAYRIKMSNKTQGYLAGLIEDYLLKMGITAEIEIKEE